jgi:hypothetical protein
MDPREIRLVGVDWMHLAQDRDRWRAINSVATNLEDSTAAMMVLLMVYGSTEYEPGVTFVGAIFIQIISE